MKNLKKINKIFYEKINPIYFNIFLTSLSNSISAPIKVSGLDVTMDLKTSEDILKKKLYL